MLADDVHIDAALVTGMVGEPSMLTTRRGAALSLLCALAFAATGCSSDSSPTPDTLQRQAIGSIGHNVARLANDGIDLRFKCADSEI